MSSPPFFSVVIPTYNRGHLIEDGIRSILKQNFVSYEIIVVDDGSTDDTEAVVSRFIDKRVIYYKKKNEERGAARNHGWQRANGRYVTFLDSDDQLYPHHLQAAFNELEKLSCPFCYAQAFEVKDFKTGKIIEPGYKARANTINDELFEGNFLACFGVFVRREVFDEVRFEEERKFAGTEDWLLWLQLAARHPFYFSNSLTGALFHHDERSILSISEESLHFKARFIKERLMQDSAFLKKFGTKGVDRARAHVLTYAALNFAIQGKDKQSLAYLFKALKTYPPELLHKRTLGIFKTLFFK